jgi:hypothetical protein
LSKFAQILGILNNTFKPTLAQKFSKINVYNGLALPILLHGCETYALRKRVLTIDMSMKIFRKQPGTTFLTTKGMKKF